MGSYFEFVLLAFSPYLLWGLSCLFLYIVIMVWIRIIEWGEHYNTNLYKYFKCKLFHWGDIEVFYPCGTVDIICIICGRIKHIITTRGV